LGRPTIATHFFIIDFHLNNIFIAFFTKQELSNMV